MKNGHSEKNGHEISKTKLQHFMQNNILKQEKVTENGAGYMEHTAQVKRQPV